MTKKKRTNRITEAELKLLRESALEYGLPITHPNPKLIDYIRTSKSHRRYRLLDRLSNTRNHTCVSGKFAYEEILKRPWLEVYMTTVPMKKVYLEPVTIGYKNPKEIYPTEWQASNKTTDWRLDLDDISATTPEECRQWLLDKGINHPIWIILKTSINNGLGSFHVVFYGGPGDWTIDRKTEVCNQLSGVNARWTEHPKIINGVDYQASLGFSEIRAPGTFHYKTQSWINDFIFDNNRTSPHFNRTSLPQSDNNPPPVTTNAHRPTEDTKTNMVRELPTEKEKPAWADSLYAKIVEKLGFVPGKSFKRFLMEVIVSNAAHLIRGSHRISQDGYANTLNLLQQKLSFWLRRLRETGVLQVTEDYIPKQKARSYQFTYEFYQLIKECFASTVPRFAKVDENGQYLTGKSQESILTDIIGGTLAGKTSEEIVDYIHERCAYRNGSVRRSRRDIEGYVDWVHEKLSESVFRLPARLLEYTFRSTVDVDSPDYRHPASLSWQSSETHTFSDWESWTPMLPGMAS